MKYIILIITISILLLSGCSNERTVNELKQENEQLKQENTELSLLKAKNVDQLKQKIITLQNENKSQKEIITIYQEAFKLLQSETNILTDTLSIFSPDKVKIGSHVAGLVVSNISKESANGTTSYFVDFIGEFEVDGSIVFNQVSGSKYSFIVEENIVRLPHSIDDFERNKVIFNILNDNELEKALGNKLINLPQTGHLKIKAIFKDYSYKYVPKTDVKSTAVFLGLK